ncbi:MAG: DUF1310 family protein [Abiotrophia defectiva]|jgi:hypothetical secreted protein
MADKKEKKAFLSRWGLLIFYVGMLLLPIGTNIWRHWQIEAEVNRTLHSAEVQKKIEEDLKWREPKAFEAGGKIQSYTIDYESKSIHPMGGIVFRSYINGDKTLTISFILDKDTRTGTYTLSSSASEALAKLLEENTDE